MEFDAGGNARRAVTPRAARPRTGPKRALAWRSGSGPRRLARSAPRSAPCRSSWAARPPGPTARSKSPIVIDVAASGRFARKLPFRASSSATSSSVTREELQDIGAMSASTSRNTSVGARCSSWRTAHPAFGSCSTGAGRTGTTLSRSRHAGSAARPSARRSARDASPDGSVPLRCGTSSSRRRTTTRRSVSWSARAAIGVARCTFSKRLPVPLLVAASTQRHRPPSALALRNRYVPIAWPRVAAGDRVRRACAPPAPYIEATYVIGELRAACLGDRRRWRVPTSCRPFVGGKVRPGQQDGGVREGVERAGRHPAVGRDDGIRCRGASARRAADGRRGRPRQRARSARWTPDSKRLGAAP